MIDSQHRSTETRSTGVAADNRRPALLSNRIFYYGRRNYRLKLLIPCELNNRESASFQLLSTDIIDLLRGSPLQTAPRNSAGSINKNWSREKPGAVGSRPEWYA